MEKNSLSQEALKIAKKMGKTMGGNSKKVISAVNFLCDGSFQEMTTRINQQPEWFNKNAKRMNNELIGYASQDSTFIPQLERLSKEITEKGLNKDDLEKILRDDETEQTVDKEKNSITNSSSNSQHD